MMRKIYLIINLTWLCLTIHGQETRFEVYHKDCSIFDKNVFDKISHIDSLVFINALNYGNTYTGDYFQPMSYDEFIKFSKIKSIPRRSVRIYYKLSLDLRSIYIMGFTQNHLIQTEALAEVGAWNLWNTFGENEFISRPKFVVPLKLYSTYISQKDFKDILTLSEVILENNIAMPLITLRHDTIVSVLIDSLEAIPSYERSVISNILFETQTYRAPIIDSKNLLSQNEAIKYMGCKEFMNTPFGDSTVIRNGTIDGLEISFEYKIERGNYNLDVMDTAVSKIQITNNFIGIRFKACDKSELDNTIWMTWVAFFKEYNDPIFEQAIIYRLNDYLFKKLINK